MEQIFENKDGKYSDLLQLIAENKTVLVADRGFIGFENVIKKKQQQDPTFFPNLSFARPVSKKDPITNQYNADEADTSRAEVTSIRFVVENVHAQWKTWNLFRQQGNPSFLRDHMEALLNFIVAGLNKFGYNRVSGRKQRPFTPEQIIQTLVDKNNEFIFSSKLNEYLVDQSHDLSYKKRVNWEETPYTSVPLMFPKQTELEIQVRFVDLIMFFNLSV